MLLVKHSGTYPLRLLTAAMHSCTELQPVQCIYGCGESWLWHTTCFAMCMLCHASFPCTVNAASWGLRLGSH